MAAIPNEDRVTGCQDRRGWSRFAGRFVKAYQSCKSRLKIHRAPADGVERNLLRNEPIPGVKYSGGPRCDWRREGLSGDKTGDKVGLWADAVRDHAGEPGGLGFDEGDRESLEERREEEDVGPALQ
jgi:hypothetical protein